MWISCAATLVMGFPYGRMVGGSDRESYSTPCMFQVKRLTHLRVASRRPLYSLMGPYIRVSDWPRQSVSLLLRIVSKIKLRAYPFLVPAMSGMACTTNEMTYQRLTSVRVRSLDAIARSVCTGDLDHKQPIIPPSQANDAPEGSAACAWSSARVD